MDAMQWMSSAMHAARARLDVATHNLANASVGAFRRDEAHARLTAGGVAVETRVSAAQGALHRTGRALDLAIAGPGSFDLADARTRDGAFSVDAQGFLSDGHGRRVRGARGPIPWTPETTFERDGSVRRGGALVDRLALAPGSRLYSGMLERANVDPIGEMLAVLDAQRAFESAQKTLVAVDETRAKAVNDAGRLK